MSKTIEYFREEFAHQRNSKPKQMSLVRTWSLFGWYCKGMFVYVWMGGRILLNKCHSSPLLGQWCV